MSSCRRASPTSTEPNGVSIQSSTDAGPGVATPDGTLWLPSPHGISGFEGTTTTHLTVGPEGVPPIASTGEPVRAQPADGGSVRLSTSIGDIEFHDVGRSPTVATRPYD